MNLIELKDIYKTYHLESMDVPVLRGISFSIKQGDYLALMGSSGSGKSTLLNLLGCLDRPSSGEYWLDGEEISKLTSNQRAHIRNSKIGFIFQSFNLLRRTSALDNVLMPLSYSTENISEADGKKRAKDLLIKVGLGDRMDHEPSQLSGGQQQRVAIARSLINNPRIILADEPTGNLDSKTTKEVMMMFKELNEKDGITIILVTHESEVAEYTKRAIRLHDGQISSDQITPQGNT